MPGQLTVAILAGLGGMIGWGCADFFAKKTIDELGDVITLAWAGLFGTIGFLIAIFYQLSRAAAAWYVPLDPLVWLGFVFFGSLQAAVYIFVYRGFAKGQVGLLSPTFASFAGIVAIISIVFLGEAATDARIASLIVVFGGILVMNADPKSLSFNKIAGLGDVFVGTILAAAWTILWERFVSGHDSLFYAFYMFAFMTIAVFLFAFGKGMRFRVERPTLWIFLAAIGLCETVAYLSISIGYALTPLTSVVAVLSAAFSLPTIILARLVLHERTTRLQTAGMVLAIAGVVLLAVI